MFPTSLPLGRPPSLQSGHLRLPRLTSGGWGAGKGVASGDGVTGSVLGLQECSRSAVMGRPQAGPFAWVALPASVVTFLGHELLGPQGQSCDPPRSLGRVLLCARGGCSVDPVWYRPCQSLRQLVRWTVAGSPAAEAGPGAPGLETQRPSPRVMGARAPPRPPRGSDPGLERFPRCLWSVSCTESAAPPARRSPALSSAGLHLPQMRVWFH